MKTDEIALNLGTTLKEFLGFFNNELQRKVLELDNNVLSKEYFQHLIRVSNSLEQYIKKDIGLFYIGFLGSYSSGKTSTINSLLNIWNTDKARKVSNNPTDDCITLITNQNNVGNVFTFVKEGAISIRTNTGFDIPFLNKIVIMDTPGSGDPNIIEGIVRDSLPLCDLIIYTLNATAPFTDIDKPFLLAQQIKLKNIPLLFVITRADEYKKENSEVISHSNFDNIKCKEDIKTIITRINESLTISSFTEEDVILIDNKDKFNIDKLVDKINEHTINEDKNLISLHNHKLNYFRNEVKTIHNYYLDLTNTKIDKCEKFILKAKDNIEYFDQQIEVSKMKFRALWNENIKIFSQIFDGTIKGYIDVASDDLKRLQPFADDSRVITHRSDVKSKFKELSQQITRNLLNSIEEKAFSELTKIKNQVIDEVNFETFTLSNDRMTFKEEINYLYEFPFEKQNYIDGFNNIYRQKISDDYKVLKDIYQKFIKTLNQKRPLDSINDNILKYKNDSIEILNLYYDAIKMYNVVAFSFEVKNYISELGLAKEFDELESGEISKTKYNLHAEKELLGNFKESSEAFEANLNLEIENSLDLKEKINKFDTSIIYENYDTSFSKSTFTYRTQEISNFLTESYRTLIIGLQNSLGELKNDINELNKSRTKKYLLFSTLPFSLILLIWIGTNYSNIPTPTSFFSTIITGIVCSLIATLLVSATDKYKNIRYKRIDSFKNKIMENNDKLIIESFNNFKKSIYSKRDEIELNIQEKWLNEEEEILSELLKCPLYLMDSEIINLKKELLSLLDSYKNTYNIFNQDILRLFNNQEELFIKIDNVASNIKEDSIRPSFQLLKKTMEEINTVKKEIEILDY